MKESDSVDFFVGLFKLKPSLAEQKFSDIFKIMDQVQLAMYGIKATRDHVKLALAHYKKNAVKRRWDLKYKYAVRIFLMLPTCSITLAKSTIDNLFNQNTRKAVIETAQQDALAYSKEHDKNECNKFCEAVQLEYSEKSREPAFIS